MNQTTTVADVTSDTFEREVIAASHDQPVVVDFWAPWCGPCRQLSPLLERQAERHRDDVRVVKLNVDGAPQLAQRFGVQGIPAVKAFRDGRVVDEFVGAQPERVIEQFFAALAPSVADRLVAQAAASDRQQREALLREALAREPDHVAATVALVEELVDRGESEEARQLLGRVEQAPAARRLAARLALAGAAGSDVAALRSRVEAGEFQARPALGRALAAQGEYDEALAVLIEGVRQPQTRAEARGAVLEVFELLGADDPRVRAWRPKLASALF